jgi:hypothetical protein
MLKCYLTAFRNRCKRGRGSQGNRFVTEGKGTRVERAIPRTPEERATEDSGPTRAFHPITNAMPRRSAASCLDLILRSGRQPSRAPKSVFQAVPLGTSSAGGASPVACGVQVRSRLSRGDVLRSVSARSATICSRAAKFCRKVCLLSRLRSNLSITLQGGF